MNNILSLTVYRSVRSNGKNPQAVNWTFRCVSCSEKSSSCKSSMSICYNFVFLIDVIIAMRIITYDALWRDKNVIHKYCSYHVFPKRRELIAAQYTGRGEA
jgi:hypothetical protein